MTHEQTSGRSLVAGISAISKFYGLPVSKTYRLAAQGLLPGVFKMGRGFFLDPSTASEDVRIKAKGAR